VDFTYLHKEIILKHFIPRSDDAHQESVRRRLLYIHEEIKIYCDGLIVTSYIAIETYSKN